MTQCQQGKSSFLVQWYIAEIASCCHPSWYYIMLPLAGRRDVVLCELHHLCLCERQDRVSQETMHSSQQLSSCEFFKSTELSSLYFSTIVFFSVSWKCVHGSGTRRLERRDPLAYKFSLVFPKCSTDTLNMGFLPLSLLWRLCALFLLLPLTFSVPSICTGTSLSLIFNSFLEWWDDYVSISRACLLLRQATGGGCCTCISQCIWRLILGWKCKLDKAKQII